MGKHCGPVPATQGNTNTKDNSQVHEWHWENWAYSEIGEQVVALFMGEFMVEWMRIADMEEQGEEGAGGSGTHQQGK